MIISFGLIWGAIAVLLVRDDFSDYTFSILMYEVLGFIDIKTDMAVIRELLLLEVACG